MMGSMIDRLIDKLIDEPANGLLASCVCGDGGPGSVPFVLGDADPRFRIPAGAPSHAVLLADARFDASSAAEPGGTLVAVLRGLVGLEGPRGCWSLLSGQMVYIPPRRPYRLRAGQPSDLVLVKLTADEVDWRRNGCWAVAMTVLAREMILQATRWNPDDDGDGGEGGSDGVAGFFRTLGFLCGEWFDRRRVMWTPYGETAEIGAAIRYARGNLHDLSIGGAAAAAGLSERTLRRRFQEELGISWRDFLQEMRMNRAMELLGLERRSVGDTAREVGFSSAAAFTVAFSSHSGLSPSAFARDRGLAQGLAQGSPQGLLQALS